MKDWEKKSWKLSSSGGGSQGYTVRCKATDEYGLAKPIHLHQDTLTSLLADAVKLAVPKVVLGTCEGKLIAVSQRWGERSMDLTEMKRDHPEVYASTGVQEARKNASGLLALNAWIGNNADHKDDHLVARPGPAPETYELAIVDFQVAFQEGTLNGPVQVTGPPSLTDRSCYDQSVLDAAIKTIETLSDEIITKTVGSLPDSVLPSADKERTVKSLIDRKSKIRAAFKATNWLPDPPVGAKKDG